MKMPGAGAGAQQANAAAAAAEVGEINKKSINGELWQACAGPLVNLPAPGTHVVYFPQGHSAQVAASMKKDVDDAQIPNYLNLPSKLLCLLHNVTLHADPETDEVYAQMTLQTVPSFDKDALLRSDLTMKSHKPQTEFFCKTLTASDTSTHGGFSVPRRAAEKIFPPLDFMMQPPAQELVARDLHDNVWTFRHVYRGQPKRHLLTTGWSLFVSGKRLFVGDSVLFIRDEKQQLLLGIRRASRQLPNLSSSVLTSDSMHIGILAAAAHAAANNSPFTVFYNPRASQSEFVIPLAMYYKAVCSNQISLGMRFRMMFETEESGTRRYMGTITGISDLDPVRWKNSQWRNLQAGWDESTAGEKRNRVSIWEIEPVTAPFFICPTLPFFRCPRQPGMLDDDPADLDSLCRRTMPWLGDDVGLKDQQALSGLSLVQWMNMQQQQNPASILATTIQPPNYIINNPLSNSILQSVAAATEMSHQFGLPSTLPQISQQINNVQFNNTQRPTTQPLQPQLDQLYKSLSNNPLASIIQQPQQQLPDISQPHRQTLVSQTTSQVQSSLDGPSQAQHVLQQQQSLLNHQLQINLSQNLSQQLQQQILGHAQLQNLMPSQSLDHSNQNLHVSDTQMQLQLLQQLHQQQQSLLAQQPAMQQPSQLLHNQQKQQQLLDIPPNFSKSMPMSTSQTLDSSQATPNMLPQSHVIAQQMMRSNSQTNLQFTQQPEVSEFPGHVGHTLNYQLSAGGGRSAVTDDVPSCSTSPSANNYPSTVPSMVNSRNHGIAQSSTAMINSNRLETLSSSGNLTKDLEKRADAKPSVNLSKGQNQGFFASQLYVNATNGNHIDYLDSSSSATSVRSQNDVQIPPPNNPMSFNSTRQMLFRDANHDGDPRNHVPFASNIDSQLDTPVMSDPLMTKTMVVHVKDFPTTSGGGMLSSYENPKDDQPELSSSTVSQSFGVPEMTFNSAVNDVSFMNRGAWAQAQIPRMRTYTKVYKRGAVGRSIDITRYSGYDELKQDLARRFGIEGQLEDQQRIGWKLVYVDHENDVLLLGDDPWEEFVNCVRCIRILSPHEVQQMSLDGDFGNSILQNQKGLQ